jgi:hypothetical protein
MSWNIREYDSDRETYSKILPGYISEREITRILRHLAARHLSCDEIVRSNLRRNMIDRLNLLEVRREGGTLSLGENPFIIAKYIDANRK